VQEQGGGVQDWMEAGQYVEGLHGLWVSVEASACTPATHAAGSSRMLWHR
jgi:hypothetical protein